MPGYHAADTKGAPRLYLLGGGEGHRWRLLVIKLQYSLGQSCPAGFAAKASPPDTSKMGE